MSEVCVIIPMYNFNGMTKDCIDALILNAGYKHDIVIVDDGSQYPYEDERIKYPGFLYIRKEKNEGFTEAINSGLKVIADIGYKYVLILNNDTIPEPGFLKRLVEVMDADEAIGIAGCSRKVPWNGEGTYELDGMDIIRGHSRVVYSLEHDVRDCEWVAFCAVMIRTSVIQEVGLLDKRMKNYCSDNDYCIRVKQAGYRVVVVPDSVVYHYRGTTIREHEPVLKLGDDQKVFLQKITGYEYNQLMVKMPLDIERGLWGKIEFSTYTQEVKE